MARKSAARVKPMAVKKAETPSLPPIEETWDNIKQVVINTAEAATVVAKRVDNLGNIRAAAYKFFGNEFDSKYPPFERMEYLKNVHQMTVAWFEDILDIVKSWEMDEFLKEDMKDYFEDMVVDMESIITEDDLFAAMLKFDIVKPWGEKMNQIHQQMLGEKQQREFKED